MPDSLRSFSEPKKYLAGAIAAVVLAGPAFAGKPIPLQLRSEISELILPESLPLIAAADPAAPAGADQEAPPPAEASGVLPPAAASPSRNVTMNLIRKLVEKGLLSQQEADEMIQQAEEETANAQLQTQALQGTINQVQAMAAEMAPDPALTEASGSDAMRVTYVPETVKAELREQIKREVMAQAKNERWAAPRTLPDWTTRVRLFGDVRVRGEYNAFPSGNDNTGAFPNFNAINTGAPFDVSGTVFSPQLNVDRDRERMRLRVRLGLEADLGEGFTAGLRLATGENNSPVSPNQSLGAANQTQGGMFSKYAIWLDRGFLKYEVGGLDPDRRLTVTAGRFDNPFFATENIWDDDLGFDGVAMHGRYQVAKGVTPWLTAGAFPVFNTDFNFSSNNPAKFKSSDKWLYAVQAGVDWQIKKDWNVKLAAAYYYFDDVQGKLSDPFVPLTSSDQGNTDNTRPSFAQKGNTYRPLRNIVPTAANNFGTTNQFQYYGLATPFRELAITGRIEYTRWEPYKFSLTGEFVKNLAFDREDINAVAVNNRGPDNALGQIGDFDGGDTAWYVDARFGHATFDRAGRWAFGVNYRYIESDAVVDGFADSDFGGGGTNLKGYTLYALVALSPRMSLGVRWMSANEIAGPPFKADVFQLDISGKF